jgi:O-antigen ligase
LIGSATEHRPAAGDERRDRKEGRSSEVASACHRVSPELLALAALFLLTAAFGRNFSKLELGASWLHPTEFVLGAVLVAALARLTPAEALRRIRATGAVVPLLVLWLFGAIAAVRGLSGWGFSKTLEDIGLVEYSVLIPLLSLTVRDRFDLAWLSRIVAMGGVLAIIVQAAELWAPLSWDLEGRLELIEVASGMYVGVFAAWVAARVAAGVRPAAWQYLVLVLGVGLTIAAASRAAWVGMLVGFAVVVAVAPSGRRLAATGFVAAVLLFGAAVSVPVHAPTGVGAPRVVPEVQASFDESGGAPANANARWRIAYWKFLLEESARRPAVGIGFGRPTNFQWSGITYDARTGDPEYAFDVTPPHNSFLNLLYRTGLAGLLAVAAIVFVAVRRLLPVARRAQDEDRALAIYLLAALAAIGTIACFAVALEGPYMGIFFWGVLGLALLAPEMLERGPTAGTTRQPGPVPIESSRSCATVHPRE